MHKICSKCVSIKFFMFFICFVCLMVLNTTFNNISVISWWPVLLVEDIGEPGENHRPVASHWQAVSHNVTPSTPCHERGSNSNGDKHWLHIKLLTLVSYRIWILLHTLMSWRTIRPPLLFWYFISFSACSRSSSDDFLKNLLNPGSAMSSLSK